LFFGELLQREAVLNICMGSPWVHRAASFVQQQVLCHHIWWAAHYSSVNSFVLSPVASPKRLRIPRVNMGRLNIVGSPPRGMPTMVDCMKRCTWTGTRWWQRHKIIPFRPSAWRNTLVLCSVGLYWPSYMMRWFLRGSLTRLI
jgi:hypothetical protein